MHIDLPDFASISLLVAGDVMLDRYWKGNTERISPEAPVPVMRVTGDEVRPGGAGNVALNAAALGAKTILLGIVGEDPEAGLLSARLSSQGVSCNFVTVPERHTITKLRIVSKNQQLMRLDFEDETQLADPGAIVTRLGGTIGAVQGVLLSDYAKGALTQVGELISLAKTKGLPVIVDPKGVDFTRYRHATVLTPNQAEFEAVVGKSTSDTELASRAEALRADLDLEALLVTRGERGMLLIEQGQTPMHLPTQAREVFDVTGAGDTVVATLGVALAAGLPLREAVQLANMAAGIVVGKFGTATASLTELRTAMDAHLPLHLGTVDEETLVRLVARARTAGERIVMTNGCFDILHPGHVAYLKQARALGDRLIVAVNDDASVSRLKGSNRPINNVEARMEVLAALASVDWVVPFIEDTPERLICRLAPDFLVKGGDYAPEDIAGSHCVYARGGEVRTLPFLDGHSTTATLAKIAAHD